MHLKVGVVTAKLIFCLVTRSLAQLTEPNENKFSQDFVTQPWKHHPESVTLRVRGHREVRKPAQTYGASHNLPLWPSFKEHKIGLGAGQRGVYTYEGTSEFVSYFLQIKTVTNFCCSK